MDRVEEKWDGANLVPSPCRSTLHLPFHLCLWPQENSVQPGKRPLSFLLPTVVRPAEGLCGTYLALGANGAARGLSGLTQVRFTP